MRIYNLSQFHFDVNNIFQLLEFRLNLAHSMSNLDKCIFSLMFCESDLKITILENKNIHENFIFKGNYKMFRIHPIKKSNFV